MVSSARDGFLAELRAFVSASAEQSVTASTSVGGFLRRGMSVASFNLLESFLDNRVAELAVHVNGGRTQFLDLPERLQRRAILQTLEVANARLRRGTLPTQDLRLFARTIGQNLSAVANDMNLSAFTWLWSGSNVSADEVGQMFSFFQIDKAWTEALIIAGKLGYATGDIDGSDIDLKADFAELAVNRNNSAHVASHTVTSLWLRAMPDRIMRIAVATDVMVSASAHLIRTGDPVFLSGQKWRPSDRIRYRFVRERSKDFGEYVGEAKRASRTSVDGDGLFVDASFRCIEFEVLVRQDVAGNVVNWSIPSVG